MKNIIIVQSAHAHLIPEHEKRPVFIGSYRDFKKLSACIECGKKLNEKEFVLKPGYCEQHR